MFHRFVSDISCIELPQRFNNPFYYIPHKLCVLAAEEVRGILNSRSDWAVDASKGKMFGVLVVRSNNGEIGYLAGFSGLLCGSNRQEGFVPPIFDFLSPDGYFKSEEERIGRINSEITTIKKSQEYVDACRFVECAEKEADAIMAQRREEYSANKVARAARRAGGNLLPEEEALLIRNSQFEKAELKRLAKRCREKVELAKMSLNPFTERIRGLSFERKARSAALQEWLFTQFKVLNNCGEYRSLLKIFTKTLPPAGAGECAAPKLLQYAYENNYKPIAMAEFWVGASPVGEVRHDGCFYGSCKSKCYPILSFMLQGLDVEDSALERGGENVGDTKIIYEDGDVVVVEKPQGVLSVPGVVGGCSVYDWLRAKYSTNDIYIVHRLDMATSGILVVAKSLSVYKKLQAQFAERNVQKRYIALLEGVPECECGEIALPLVADYENRPRCKVDFVAGKPSLTHYKVLRVIEEAGAKRALVVLTPVTGRTHQLRLHCAHSQGLGIPIVGDALYGSPAERLMLNAAYISFIHPVTGEKMELSCSADFENL